MYTYTVTDEIRWKIFHQFLINSQQKAFIISTSARAFFRLRESTRYSVTRVGENSARGLALLMPNPLANLSPARLNYSRRRRNAARGSVSGLGAIHKGAWQNMTTYDSIPLIRKKVNPNIRVRWCSGLFRSQAFSSHNCHVQVCSIFVIEQFQLKTKGCSVILKNYSWEKPSRKM